MPYIPAILVTLYDGYYIYSPSENTYLTGMDESGQNEMKTGYTHILKPYVYYSAKYVSGNNYIVVNYSLDNYIAIYGIINNNVISKSGYLESNDFLNNVDINGENLSENIIFRTLVRQDTYRYTEIKNCKYIYNNGRKNYYIDGKWYVLNGTDLVKAEPSNVDGKDYSAKEYVNKAREFMSWLDSSEGNSVKNIVIPQNARNAKGESYEEFSGDTTKILTTDPEDNASAFNQHKREIIKLSIQENLNNAIAIYNAHSSAMGTSASFRMPVLGEEDWEKIITNVNFVTFMQGLPIGNKLYNNYAIVTSTSNKQYISPDSIYIVDTNAGEFHTYEHALKEASKLGNIIGYKSADFQKVKYEGKNAEGEDAYLYYYRRPEYGDYSCIVETYVENEKIDNDKIKKAYYTALARERYSLDKVTKILINYNQP